MHFVKNRNRPWAFLSRDFWKYLDYFLAELNGGFCVPKIDSNPTSYICLIVLILVHVPLALMAIPFVILNHFIGSYNHVSIIYDETKKPMKNKDNSLTVLSCNTCLMPEGLARANNLPFVEERAKQIADLCTSEYYSPIDKTNFEMIVTDLPNDIDIICFQEVFNEHAWNILNQALAKAGFNYFLYDPHDQFIKSSTFHFLPLINSGLYMASKYPIRNSKFVSYKSAYLEDGLCNKGILMAEVEIDSTRSAVVCTTHLQKPTGGNKVKASDARCSQWEMIQSTLDDFKSEITSEDRQIVVETLCGDFNTDFINSYDQKCKNNLFYETFVDAHQSGVDVGTCLVEESCRLNEISTPEGLKKKLLECDKKYIWSSDRQDENGECISTDNGKSKLDYIYYRGKLRFEYGQIHTTFAGLTDHLALSATFECAL